MAKIWINGREIESDGTSVEIRVGDGAKLNIDTSADLVVEGVAMDGLAELAALSEAEAALLDGAGTGGTVVASKVQVGDANQNLGVIKGTNLHLGTSGSETEVTATAEELNTVDRSKCVWFTDFQGGAIGDIPEITVKAGSGTGNNVALSTQRNGAVQVLSASDDGAWTANASMIEMGKATWRAANGGLVMEARLTLNAITDAYCFMGFTDASQASTLEAPIYLNGADIDSDASDACGICFDTDGTTSDLWFQGGVKADTDTAPTYSASAPVAFAYQTLRLEVASDGAIEGFVGGTSIGTTAAAITSTTALFPIIIVANRGAAARYALVDYWHIEHTRG